MKIDARILPLMLCAGMALKADETLLLAQNDAGQEGWFHAKKAGRYTAGRNEAAELARWAEQSRIDLRLRTLWLDERFASDKTTATAAGGMFGFTTPDVHGLSGKIEAYTSQKFWGINPSDPAQLNPELYSDGDSFTYIAEAELRYRVGALNVRAGRMYLETPFADPDDIRMAPNTFEGISADYGVDARWKVRMMYLTRWAGFDSSSAQKDFVRFTDDSAGMFSAAVTYESDDAASSVWYYHADRLFDLGYMEATGKLYIGASWHLDWGLQAAQMGELDASGIEGAVVGAMAMAHWRNLYAGGAYNYAMVAEGKHVTDGMGGGPYFTSLDETTVAGASEMAPGHDISVFRLGGGADVAWWLHDTDSEGLHAEAMYGVFDSKGSDVSVDETDVMLWLALSERVRLDAVFAHFEVHGHPQSDSEDFDRYWVRAEYGF